MPIPTSGDLNNIIGMLSSPKGWFTLFSILRWVLD
jgi:hypothetical protein